MFSVKVNEKYDYRISSSDDKIMVDDANIQFDCVETGEGRFNILIDNRSYNAEILENDPVSKSFLIKVNGKKQRVVLKDRYDLLLSSLGMDSAIMNKVNEVKAPMPGLVLSILVEEGQQVQKDQPLLVLEAMKMENIIKSSGEGTVKKLAVSVKGKVEKNQVLVQFE